MIFKGDAAFVCFTAEVEANTPDGPSKRTLRIADFYTKQNGQWIQTGSDTELHPSLSRTSIRPRELYQSKGRNRCSTLAKAVWRAYSLAIARHLKNLIPEETVNDRIRGRSFGTRTASSKLRGIR